jgi:hypothetical protein
MISFKGAYKGHKKEGNPSTRSALKQELASKCPDLGEISKFSTFTARWFKLQLIEVPLTYSVRWSVFLHVAQ